MATVAGVVVNGRVELEEELPEGARVRVRTEMRERPPRLDTKSVRELAASARSLDRGHGIPAGKVLKRLARRHRS